MTPQSDAARIRWVTIGFVYVLTLVIATKRETPKYKVIICQMDIDTCLTSIEMHTNDYLFR